MMEELRCYTFTDFSLREIQQGIQAGHAAIELFNKYLIQEGWQGGYADMINDWAANHKTMICLNGGMYGDVCEWLAFFEMHENPYPFTGFVEEPHQGGNLTSVAVILPARIFDTAARLRTAKYNDDVSVTWDHLMNELRVGWFDEQGVQHNDTFNEWERDLMNKLNGCQLAR